MLSQIAVDVWYNQTTLHPFGVVAVMALSLLSLFVPRRFALVPMLVLACFIPSAQRIVIATLDFDFLRLMILAGWVRVFLRGELRPIRWKLLDTAVVAWSICATVMATLLHSSMSEFINRLGHLYDAAGLYFLCRVIVRDWKEVFTFARCAAVISIPVAAAFTVELLTRHNMFSVFGGVPEITTIRDGRLRCQGPFSHPILAGCFWAALTPLIAAIWRQGGQNRLIAVIGVACAGIVIYACASATPLLGVLAGLIAAALYPFRRSMRVVRWGTLLVLIALQLVMTQPVWHLMTRLNIVSGATGWYRYKLFDAFVENFDEWWLIGTDLDSVSKWWEYEFQAITNEYVSQGVAGGLLTLGLFIAIIVIAFRDVGRMWRRAARPRLILQPAAEGISHRNLRRDMLRHAAGARVLMAWALGISLFIHVMVFQAVTYFDQTIFVWYLTIGLIGSLTPSPRTRRSLLARIRPIRGESVPAGPAGEIELALPAQ